MNNEDHEATARAIVESIPYVTIATAGEDGVPWASPVWFATADYREFFWVSDPSARHSRNIAVQPRLAMVIFDSHAPLGAGQGVYISATAVELAGADLERGAQIFSRASLRQGGGQWTADELRRPAVRRLYLATASDYYLGNRDDRRMRLRSIAIAAN